jgi:hypothetical protein
MSQDTKKTGKPINWGSVIKVVGIAAIVAAVFLWSQNKSDKAYEAKSDTNSKASLIAEGLSSIIYMCEDAYEADYYTMQETLYEISKECESLKKMAEAIEDRYADRPASEPARIPSF